MYGKYSGNFLFIDDTYFTVPHVTTAPSIKKVLVVRLFCVKVKCAMEEIMSLNSKKKKNKLKTKKFYFHTRYLDSVIFKS